MTVSTVLFIGYSVNDPDVQLILENINIYSHSEHSHYALVEKFEHTAIKAALKETYNITYLEYARGQHNLVTDYISELTGDVKDVRTKRGIV